MTFQPKPSYLPEDVKHFTAPRTRMDLVWAFIAFLLAVVAYMEPVEQVNAAPQAPAGAAPSAIIAACMNGGGISWRDPHTDHAMLTICDTHKVRVGR